MVWIQSPFSPAIMLPCHFSLDFFHHFLFFPPTLPALFPLRQELIISSFEMELLFPVCSPKAGGKLSPQPVLLQRGYLLQSAGCIPKFIPWAHHTQRSTKLQRGWGGKREWATVSETGQVEAVINVTQHSTVVFFYTQEQSFGRDPVYNSDLGKHRAELPSWQGSIVIVWHFKYLITNTLPCVKVVRVCSLNCVSRKGHMFPTKQSDISVDRFLNLNKPKPKERHKAVFTITFRLK